MSQLARTALRSNCIEHKSKFVHSELERVKLTQSYDDGSTKTKKCPCYSGEHGVESLLYVEERFRTIARQLSFTDGGELFDNFEEVLTDSAEEKWLNLTVGVAEVNRTPARFDQAMEACCQRHVDEFARDSMIKYLPTIKKPFSADTRTHVDRMETLFRYTNKLPGAEPPLTEQQQKNIIFDTFPVDWRQNYIRAGKDVRTDTTPQLVQHMSNEKSFADQKKDSMSGKKRKAEDGDKGPSRMRGGGQDKKKKSSKPKPDDPCPWHEGHKWKACYDNPEGYQFRPRNPGGRGGGRNGGRGFRGGRGGGGRGFGGRGNYGGRGGYSNGDRNQGGHQGNQGSSNSYHFNQEHQNGGNHQDETHPAQAAPPSTGWNAESHHFDQIGGPRGTRGGIGYNSGGMYSGRRF